MVIETAKITGFGEDRHCIDRPYPGDRRRQLIVGQIGQKRDGSCFNLIELADKTTPFCQYQSKHANGARLWVSGQANRSSGHGVNG